MSIKSESIDGVIFNIQQFSIYDGPGIRTVIFFKGCNLRCAWCHNPESFSMDYELNFNPDHCIGCRKCFAICRNNCHGIKDGAHIIERENCVVCGNCADICYSGAITVTGKRVGTDYVMKIILRDKAYYERSGGGVTFSGGEAMLQPEFLKSLMEKCKKEGISTAIDTAGNVAYESFQSVFHCTDMFLYDVKAVDETLHKKLCGVSSTRITENLQKLCTDGKRVLVRIPYILGGNDGDMENIAMFLSGLNIESAELLPYHKLGISKRKALGINFIEQEQNFGTPSPENISETINMFRKHKVNIIN